MLKIILGLLLPLLSANALWAQKYQKGYYKKNGTYVTPHYKTKSDNTNRNNYSAQGQINPYTYQKGHKANDYSPKHLIMEKDAPFLPDPEADGLTLTAKEIRLMCLSVNSYCFN